MNEIYNKISIENDFISTTMRHNSLFDMDCNIIADTIRKQNIKNSLAAVSAALKTAADAV